MAAKGSKGRHGGKKSEQEALQEELKELLEEHAGVMAPIYGFSHDIQRLVRVRIPECAATDFHVLVTGETGTGKELVVKGIFRRWKRRKDDESKAHIGKGKETRIPDLVSVNCAAIAPQLIESELFGYIKGAFTGATSTKKGLLDEANGGALFLDEIGEMKRHTQAKLLRVIEEGEFLRVGGTKPVKVEVRLLAATSKRSALRKDLLWRFPEKLEIPPLRERPEDVLAILHGFLKNELPGRNAQWVFWPWDLLGLMCHPWPGNARELINVAMKFLARHKRHDGGGNQALVWLDYELVEDTESKLRNAEYRLHIWTVIAEEVNRQCWRSIGRELLKREWWDFDDEVFTGDIERWQGECAGEENFYMTLREALEFFASYGNACGGPLVSAGWPSDKVTWSVGELRKTVKDLLHPVSREPVEAEWDSPAPGADALCSDKEAEKGVLGAVMSKGRVDGAIAADSPHTVSVDFGGMNLEDLEKALLTVQKAFYKKVFENHPKLTEAAKALGMAKSTLSEKLKRLGIRLRRTRVR